MQLRFDAQKSPIGTMLLVTDQHDVLHSLDFEDYQPRMHKLLKRYYGNVQLQPGRTAKAIRASLESYFDGDLDALDDLEVGRGGTEFQRAVWTRLRSIPAGQTLSYGQLAEQLGRPTASRAVGLANGAKPVAIIVPCQRGIGANGALTGYGGGLFRKQWLLSHEHCTLSQTKQLQLGLFAETAS